MYLNYSGHEILSKESILNLFLYLGYEKKKNEFLNKIVLLNSTRMKRGLVPFTMSITVTVTSLNKQETV